jgi:hypothetical protein
MCFLDILTPSTITLEEEFKIFIISPFFAFIFSRDYFNLVTFFYSNFTHYRTSGAKETNLINCLSRNSLATGPKILEPLGLLSSPNITQAFSSNFM